MKHFEQPVAAAALARWDGDPATLCHVATSGNAVYEFFDRGERRILRLTDVAYRSPADQRAEMAFLRHLDACGVQVARPVPSGSGEWVETFDNHTACVLTWAPGERIVPGSSDWDDAFVREWGRNLGAIHAASRSYTGPARWAWDEEGLVADADELLPRDDAAVRSEFDAVRAHLSAMPRTPAGFGMNHGDYAPQNFHWERGHGITSFDFGNCCTHAFVNDVVISCSVLWRLPERERWRDALLSGYRETTELDEVAWAERRWFLRMRVLYVYLSRLRKFGAHPDPDERDILRQIRSMIRPDPQWP